MKYLIPILLLLTSCSTSGQKNTAFKQPALSDEEIIEKYLKNGAWRLRYFSPEYQMYIDSAIALKPNLAYLHQQKAMPYFKQSKYELGLKSLDRAVELDPKANLDYRAFIKCIFVKSYEASIKDFLQAKELKGEHGVIMDHSYDFYLGLCYLQLGDFSTALNYLERSIEQTKKASGENWVHFLDLFYAGIASQELKRYQESIQYFDKALKPYPNFSDALYYKALSLFRTGQQELAEKTLTECEIEFKKGYTINEDNAMYEKYPYQLKQFHIDLLRLTKQ